MAYGVFESTNMRSTHAGGRIYDVVATTDIENGTIGYIDGLANDETDIYKFVAGVSEGKKVVIADQPAWSADDSKMTNQRKDNFIIKAGTPFRARVIYVDDRFAVSIDCVKTDSQTTFVKGAKVTVDATTGKFVVGDGNTGIAGEVIYERIQGATLVTAANTYGYQRKLYTIKVNEVA